MYVDVNEQKEEMSADNCVQRVDWGRVGRLM